MLRLTPAVALAAIALAAPAPAHAATTATGVVVDAQSGKPLGGVLVQQEDGLNAVFTRQDGRFALPIDPHGAQSIVFSAVGFERGSAKLSTQPLKVSLAPIAAYVPEPRPADAHPGQPAHERAPLHSQLTLAYRGRYAQRTLGGASLAGFSNNDFAIAGRFRFKRFLFDLEGSHQETPVDMAGLAREDNPAFIPSIWQIGARGGYFWPLGEHLELGAQLGYRYLTYAPNNADIRYTGTDLDVEHSRHAFGPVGTLAWRPGGGPWRFEAGLGLYPLVLGSAKAPGAPVAASFLTDLRASANYEVARGVELGAGYQYDDWRGNGYDGAHILGIHMNYTPGGLPGGEQ